MEWEVEYIKKLNFWVDDSLYKAILHGFYATANKVWKETIDSNELNLPETIEEEEMEEEKKEGQKGEEGKLTFLRNKLRTFSEHTGKSS